MVFQDPARAGEVLSALAQLLADPAIVRVRMAVAYANGDGVAELHSLLDLLDSSVDVELVITLDLGITRKAALELLLRGFPGDVRAITTAGGRGTFHAKAIVVDRSTGPQRALTGSANLTGAALTRNYEVVAVNDLTVDQSRAWEVWWSDLVHAAEPLTEELIRTYVERQPPPGWRDVIADEDVETLLDGSILVSEPGAVDAESAEWLVIDWGGTGEFRVQAELPRPAAAFFHPQLDRQRSITLRFEGRSYRDNQLAFYPDNSMPRINLDPRIPVVADGSIRSAASLYVRVGADRYDLRLLNDVERVARLRTAALSGGTNSTRRRDGTYRESGWA